MMTPSNAEPADDDPDAPSSIRAVQMENRLIVFAVRVCTLSESLPQTFSGRHVASQLFRAGTAPAAQYAEAQGAESRPDFIHKLKIAVKELRETQVWLKFITQMNYPIDPNPEPIRKEADELISILVKSIQTAQRNHHARKPSAKHPPQSP
ncbi:MAG: four helix bundle protein, partial [Rhodothermales bacterium]|nr:four helix bundle protein [Rhodothermales bacterium]